MSPAASFFLAVVLAGDANPRVQPPAAPATSPKSAGDLQPLFNEKDLTGWHAMPHFDPRTLAAMNDADRTAFVKKHTDEAKQHWKAENGEIVNDGHGAFLTTDREFRDVELWIDYKTVAKADSGIYLRATPQVQIWDSAEDDPQNLGRKFGSGGLWNNSPGAKGKNPLMKADKPLGEWNSFRIRQVGAHTWVHLNDQLVVDDAVMENYWDREAPLFARGPIQLQTHGGEIRWKNIKAREISPEEANSMLRGTDEAGFKSLIAPSGDLALWTGAVDSYVLKDGVLTCKGGKGGVLHTKEEYDDFAARIEFRLPAGGNNGLAIRYPGTGDTAYTGMCELQILDETHANYARLDARQYHGSAYGMAPSVRGYLRPVGQWNYQQITVQGSTITVELNGTRILNTDLSKINDFMGGSPHPGKNRTSGFFGFAGHNDPVEFRNVSIKRLKKQ